MIGVSISGILVGVGFEKIYERHPEYLSIGLLRGIGVFMLALLFSVYLHEIVHAIAFNLQLGFWGIVIPKLSPICNEKEYNNLRKK